MKKTHKQFRLCELVCIKYHAKYQTRYFKVAIFRFSMNQFAHTQALKQKTQSNYPTELWVALWLTLHCAGTGKFKAQS